MFLKDYNVKDNKEDIKETKSLGEILSCSDDLKSFVENLEIPSNFTVFFSNDYEIEDKLCIFVK